MKNQLLFNFTKILFRKKAFRVAAFAVVTLLSAQSSFAQVILQDEFESATDVTAGSAIFGFASGTSTSGSTGTVAPSTRVPDMNAMGNLYFRHYLNESSNSGNLNDQAKIFDTDGTTDGVLRTSGYGTLAIMDITNPKTGTTYTKPTKLKMTVTFDCSTLTTNGDVGRGVLVGYYKSIYTTTNYTATSFTDTNNGITYNTTDGNLSKGSGYNPGLDFFGFIVNATTGRINLWNGQSSKATATNAFQAYKGTWSGGSTMHTISYVVDTATGALSDFVFDGDSSYDPWTTTQFPTATFPVFTNANTNFAGLGSISSANTGYANFYSFKLENAVPQANTAPVAVADAIIVAPGGTATTLVGGATSVLTNDTDAQSNPLTAAVVTNPANGSLTLNSNGTFSYVHNGSATTTDSFTYKANDGALDSNTETVTITISSVNNAPVANNDAFSVKQGGTVVTAGATSVLTNDTDAEGNPLTAAVVTPPANGTLTLNANGTFTYLHNNSATTTDSFTYKANDGASDSNTATVNITITAPVATTNTWTGGTSTDFLVASNWTASDAPNPAVFSTLASFTVSTTANSPVLNSNYSTVSGAANCAVLTLNTGAVLATNADITTNSSSSAIAGTLNINAGTFTSRLYIQSGGIVNVASGATLTEVGVNRLGVSGAGTLNIDGGTLNSTGSGTAGLSIGATGVLNLNSGTVNYTAATALNISTGGLINIDAGSLIFNGNQTAAINAFVTAGAIKTSGAALAAGKIVSVTYDTVTNKTTVTASATTTWDGSTWSNGVPTATAEAVIAGAYTTSGSGGGFTAKKLTVNSGSLTVNSGTNVTVQNEVTNNAGANGIVIENNANLVQVNNAINAGNVVVNRNSNALYRLDYTMWSSPVASQNLAAFSPLTSQSPSRFYTYDAATGLYSNAFDPTATNFAAGTGYLIRMPNTDPTSGYDAGTATLVYPGVFTGVPNNGNVGFTGLTSDKYYAVGNPYPSTLSANAFINGNATGGTLYFWRKKNLGEGSAYASYNLVGATVTAAASGNGSEVPNGTIQVGQGFIVKTGLAATTLDFTNAMREASPTSTQFFRTKAVEKDRIWLNLTNTSGVFSQALVGYMDGATSGVDNGFDGKYINDSPVALTSAINGEEYTIQGRPAFDASDIVPLNFKTDVAGDYTIAIDHADGVFAAGQSVILADAATGTETDLTTSSYTFTATTGTANSRFSLKYQKTLATNKAVFSDNNIAVYRSKGTLHVNAGDATIANIKVYDVQGKLVTELKNVKATSASIANLKATNQVLVVKITSQENTVVTKKVVN